MPAARVPPAAFLRAVRRDGFLDAVDDLWHEHGDAFTVRIGSRRLMFLVHPDAVAHVAVTGREHYDKGRSYDRIRTYLLGEGIVGSTGDEWRRQRRLMAPFFTPKAVQVHTELIAGHALALADRWERLARAGEPVDVSDEMSDVTAAIILSAMFTTTSIGALDDIRDAVEVMVEYGTKTVGLQLPPAVPTPRNRRYLAARRFTRDAIDGVIARRASTPDSQWPDDLLSHMMSARDAETGEPMTRSLLRDEAITVFFAGHETTARTLAFVWLALAQHPDVADRLHRELDTQLGDRTPTVEDLRRLPYTAAVVDEALRLYPATAFYARDAVTDDEAAGIPVPAGTSVLLAPYFTHRHPDFWDRPERFEPERWLRPDSGTAHGHRFHPFATGPRVCIGNSFSLLESQILVAMLARRFVATLPEGFTPHWVMRGTLAFDTGLPMRITARQAGVPA